MSQAQMAANQTKSNEKNCGQRIVIYHGLKYELLNHFIKVRTVSHAYVFDLPVAPKTHINPPSTSPTRIMPQRVIRSDKFFISF
jgi:hypothetical protein